jgi:hypothetical protein
MRYYFISLCFFIGCTNPNTPSKDIDTLQHVLTDSLSNASNHYEKDQNTNKISILTEEEKDVFSYNNILTVLKKDVIGKEFEFKKTEKTESETYNVIDKHIYLGKVRTRNGAYIKIVKSTHNWWLSWPGTGYGDGPLKSRGSIDFYDDKLNLLGYYGLWSSLDLPEKLENENLVFTIEETKEKMFVNLKDSIPRTLYISGNDYSYTYYIDPKRTLECYSSLKE